MVRKDELGRRGEQLAVDHLTAQGYAILDRNWRCAIGEIDIVARDRETTVIVEVKTRSSLRLGHPFDAVTPRKLARLRRLAGAWCAAQAPTRPGPGRGSIARAVRIDVIGVVAGYEGVSIDHLQQVT